MKRGILQSAVLMIIIGLTAVFHRDPEPVIQPKQRIKAFYAEQDSIKQSFVYAQEDTLPPPSDPHVRPVVIHHDTFTISWQFNPAGGPAYNYTVYIVGETMSFSFNTSDTFLVSEAKYYPAGDYTTCVVANGNGVSSGESDRFWFRIR